MAYPQSCPSLSYSLPCLKTFWLFLSSNNFLHLRFETVSTKSKEGQCVNFEKISTTLEEAPRSQLRADNTSAAVLNVFRIHGDEGTPLRDKVMLHVRQIKAYYKIIYNLCIHKGDLQILNLGPELRKKIRSASKHADFD